MDTVNFQQYLSIVNHHCTLLSWQLVPVLGQQHVP